MLSWLITAYLLLVATISASAFFFEGFIGNNTAEKDQRLPIAVIPTSYWVVLKPDMDIAKFKGSVEIKLTCKEATNVIVLHAHKSLHIDTKFVMVTPEWNNVDSVIETAGQMMFSNSTHANIQSIRRNTTTDQLIITLVKQMNVGDSYKLYIEFSGKMKLFSSRNDYQQDYQNCGLMKGTFLETSNSSFIMSRMKVKCARRVFPCFDEPSFKASFEFSVARPKNMTTISVMPVESSEIGQGDWIWDHFEPSPPISTFSINIFISELKTGSKINVNTTRGKYSIQYHHSQHSNKTLLVNGENMIHRAIEFLEDYLDTAFPVPKLDIISFPNYFYSDVNTLGTIIQVDYMRKYKSIYLIPSLIDQWVVHTISPQWWNNLNISNILGLHLAKTAFVNITGNLDWYALETHETYNMLSNPNLLERSENLWILYSMIKGDWFLQMLKTSLSETTFKNGLGHYFNNNIYGTYNEKKLWDSLSKQAWKDGTLQEDISVQTLVKSWLHKRMFPLVTVNRNYEENSATIEQHVFMRSHNWLESSYLHSYVDTPEHKWTEEEKQMKWWIPISYLTPHNTKQSIMLPCDWMKEEQQLNITNLPNSKEFIIINPIDSGMFLVNYDQQNWNLITQTLISDKNMLPTLTRKKVLQDAALLAANGNLSYVTFLNMTLFLTNETEPLVWNPFLYVMIMDTEVTFSWTPVEQKLYQYLRKLMTPFYESIKKPSDHYDDDDKDDDDSQEDLGTEMIYYTINFLMERIGYQPYINKTNEQMNNKLPTYPVEDTQSRLIIFCPEFLNNLEEGIDYLVYAAKLDRYAQQLDYNYQMFWKTSLSRCPGYRDFIYNTLSGTLNEKKMHGDSDWQTIIALVTANPTAHNISLNFLLQNFDKLKQSLTSDHMIQLMTSVMSKVRSEEQLQMILEFYHEHEHDTGHIHHSVTKSIKDAYKRVEWDKQHLPDIIYWFDNILPKFVQL